MKIISRPILLWRKRWVKAVIYGVILIGLSIALANGLQYMETLLDTSVQRFAPTAYAIVFGITLVSNASIMVPVHIYIAIIMAAASIWNPILVAFVASVAGTLGEISGYYAGYLGKRIILDESTPGYNRIVTWMGRYGPLAVFVLAFQPFIPFDIAGLIAGTSKMPLWKFLLPCWAGRFPKYILFCYFGLGIFRLFPLWP